MFLESVQYKSLEMERKLFLKAKNINYLCFTQRWKIQESSNICRTYWCGCILKFYVIITIFVDVCEVLVFSMWATSSFLLYAVFYVLFLTVYFIRLKYLKRDSHVFASKWLIVSNIFLNFPGRKQQIIVQRT